jgi:hypothetical protein
MFQRETGHMKIRFCLFAGAAFALMGPLSAGTLELQPKETAPPTITESQPWQFTIAAPGWMASMNGTIGIRGINADLDVGFFDDVLEHLDMIFAMRAEAQKGPFGIFGEVIYLGLSDGAQINGLINNVHEEVNLTLVDGALSWRLFNQPRWSLDFAAGMHYTNVYQKLELHSDPILIQQTSERFVDDISAALRDALNGDLTDSRVTTASEQLANAVTAALRNRLNEKISNPQLINSLTNAIRTDITAAFRDLLSQRVSKGEFVSLLTREIRTEITTALRNRVREDVANELVSLLTNAIRTDITTALRDRLNQHVSNHDFVTALTNAIRTDVTTAFRNQDIFSIAIKSAIRKDILDRIGQRLEDHERHPNIPIGPLGGRVPQEVRRVVGDYINAKLGALRARVDALHLEGEARRAAVRRIVNSAKRQMANNISVILQNKLGQTLSRQDDWFDGYGGLRLRYDFNKTFYTAVRGEVGRGVVSDLMWEVEGVVGLNWTRSIFTEVGYRALSADFEDNNFKFDVTTHGPQITTGITF